MKPLRVGLIGYDGMLRGLTAIDAAHGPAGIVRVEANDITPIGRALDAGVRVEVAHAAPGAVGVSAAERRVEVAATARRVAAKRRRNY